MSTNNKLRSLRKEATLGEGITQHVEDLELFVGLQREDVLHKLLWTDRPAGTKHQHTQP